MRALVSILLRVSEARWKRDDIEFGIGKRSHIAEVTMQTDDDSMRRLEDTRCVAQIWLAAVSPRHRDDYCFQ